MTEQHRKTAIEATKNIPPAHHGKPYTRDTDIVFLPDGRNVILDDDDDIILSVLSDGKTENSFEIPYPSGGYGGGSLLLSPSGKYLVFSIFQARVKKHSHCLQLKTGI